MTAELGVEVPECGDGAKAKWKVIGVGVGVAAGLRPEIDGGACEHAVFEVALEPGVVLEQPSQAIVVVGVEPGIPEGEGA